ncbi:HD-GYP domain-containing protein [Butyrivibrio proteoclasticus]|uniref:HD-GYP domain-containing protein n=1 Tax=Butyrivibrio proteoclasticus TaxID=43305 RepID=UPI00047CFD1E|nr:HD domain-containing phosphohydrolase [Butyrivibrio proteoclasticus]
MKRYSHKANRDVILRLGSIGIGVILNVLLTLLAKYLKVPMFLNTAGTIAVAAIGGALPGILTGIITNMVCNVFIEVSMYFGVISVLIAIFTAAFVKKYSYHNVKTTVLFIVLSGIISGGGSAGIQWFLFHGPQIEFLIDSVNGISAATGLPTFLSFMLVNIIVNIVDMAICLFIAIICFSLIPERILKRIRDGRWRQRPLSDDEMRSMKLWGKSTRYSMRARLALVLLGVSFMIIIIMSWIELRFYFEEKLEEKREVVVNAAKFAASVVDPEMVDDYLKEGESAPGYKETEELLYKIRDNAVGIGYLYIVKIDKYKCTFIFDLDASKEYEQLGFNDDTEGFAPGESVPIEEPFKPYLDDLLAGKKIPTVESRGEWKWLLTAYYPIYNSKGECVAYAGADATLEYIPNYIGNFFAKIFLIMSGILISILAYGLWNTGAYMVYPINTIAMGVEKFIKAGDDQKKLDEAIKELRNYDVHTDDEVEKLYHSICDMALNQAEQMRSIRHFSESTAKMQDGLIITMADLVEKRDSDTGSHTQKTAAYVKIIVEGLKEKGYYAGKMTPKFMSDVIRSAPLHDIGKINISDSVLNKHGKLTDDEYEIIKSHTIAGKQIMENAISTIEGDNYLKEARNMAAYHHERWDGTGYPEGLHGEVIPLSARIMAVADEFDALTSERVYKKPFSFDEAMNMIREGSGTAFDPKCVEVFVDAIAEVKVVYRKYNRNI